MSKKFKIPLYISLAITPLAFWFGIILSGGAGHGDYYWTKILFPLIIISANIFGQILIPFLIIGIIQFPIYGVIIGKANENNKLLITAISILVFHILTVWSAFNFSSDSFS
tara:strand:+ start:58 stop:390 length:333 start_codon:yes stop_codon:yes gene_type:complete